MANDVFANIAASGIGGRQELLYEPAPEKIDVKKAALTSKEFVPFNIKDKISTKEELYSELSALKKYYAPFLKDVAPEAKSTSVRTYINKFVLNGEEKITLPHYGGPLGFAVNTYESEFVLEDFSDKAVYIKLMGADYKATVYINGDCVGIHEGFFSPFEFEITRFAKKGTNALRIVLENDHVFMGSIDENDVRYDGDKLYAATGLGYDDPAHGWHHCPPGMGIYNKVFVEVRNRVNITDVFVRPDIKNNSAEIWVEVENADYQAKEVEFNISVYGMNFDCVVTEDMKYIPETNKTVGMGDSLTEAEYGESLGKGMPMPLKKGKNIYKIPVKIDNAKLWELDTPYLYKAIVSVFENGVLCDCAQRSFGMREFTQDTESTPKGMFYLNGKKIRLRGANTMGFEQQDVLREDFEQLIDDILLAKLCNMNFLRLTQRPVQDEVYDYCDRLGLMTQTDLPLFGCMRRTKFCEGIRQAEEMEKMIRSHPCNVVVSYINEPFPNAHNQPHRHLVRSELEDFFKACTMVIKLNNPDRVVKNVDGDYDPPSDTLPDNHCYPMWYNAHGIDMGRLNKGYWLSIKPDWYCGCGEYGAEGLDFPDVMRECYPESWIKEPFDPANIVNAQTAGFHYFFYETQNDMESWVRESHRHQAFATRIMTEAYRRNRLMITNAIHLFIDAWPSGWMKTIMDCRRNPKPAYFEYRNALEPVMVSLRTDRYTYFSGEKTNIECFICNDKPEGGKYNVKYELYADGKPVMCGEDSAEVPASDVVYVSSICIDTPEVDDRQMFTLKAILTDENGNPVTYNTLDFEVFADVEVPAQNENTVLTLNLEPGEYEIAGEKVTVKACGMLPLHFASRNTGHKAVEGFTPYDFRNWYDKDADMITPILNATFEAEGFTPILTSGNTDDNGNWHKVLAAAEKVYDGKRYIICQVDLRTENPIAKRFKKNLLEL